MLPSPRKISLRRVIYLVIFFVISMSILFPLIDLATKLRLWQLLSDGRG